MKRWSVFFLTISILILLVGCSTTDENSKGSMEDKTESSTVSDDVVKDTRGEISASAALEESSDGKESSTTDSYDPNEEKVSLEVDNTDPQEDLSEWEGIYRFGEGLNSKQYAGYKIEIYKPGTHYGSHYYAEVVINGWMLGFKGIAKVEGNEDAVELVFVAYPKDGGLQYWI